MRKRYIVILLVSLLGGTLVSALLLGMKNTEAIGDCADPNTPLTNNVRRVDCNVTEYGFPLRFIVAEPSISLNAVSESGSSPVTIHADADATIDWLKLAANVIIWTVVLAAAIFTLNAKVLEKKPTEQQELETPKK